MFLTFGAPRVFWIDEFDNQFEEEIANGYCFRVIPRDLVGVSFGFSLYSYVRLFWLKFKTRVAGTVELSGREVKPSGVSLSAKDAKQSII